MQGVSGKPEERHRPWAPTPSHNTKATSSSPIQSTLKPKPVLGEAYALELTKFQKKVKSAVVLRQNGGVRKCPLPNGFVLYVLTVWPCALLITSMFGKEKYIHASIPQEDI